MFALPQFLSSITSAAKFAAPGGAPTWGDALQGIGNSMANHNRYGTNDPLELMGMAAKKGTPNMPGLNGSNPDFMAPFAQQFAAQQPQPQALGFQLPSANPDFMPMGGQYGGTAPQLPPIMPAQSQPGLGGLLGTLLQGGNIGGGPAPLGQLLQLLQSR